MSKMCLVLCCAVGCEHDNAFLTPAKNAAHKLTLCKHTASYKTKYFGTILFQLYTNLAEINFGNVEQNF